MTSSLARHSLSLCILLALPLLALVSCSNESEPRYSPTYAHKSPDATIQYIFAPHPLHNPNRLFDGYQPILDYINARLGIPNVELIFEAARSYDVFQTKLYSRRYHFALPNPFHTVKAQEHGYVIFGKMSNDDDFRGVILVRKDAKLKTPLDLKGKCVVFPASTALAATMMPQLFLTTHGLDVTADIESKFVGTHESVIMNVYMERCAAGGTWPPPWRRFKQERPDIADTLEVKWETGTLPNNGLVVRDDVPQPVAQKVAELLFSLSDNVQGRELLANAMVQSFVPADRGAFAPVVEFIREYDAQVRKEKP